MKKLLVGGWVACCAALASAMPSKKDLLTAQTIVSKVTADDVKALKAGTKGPAEVAKRHQELAAIALSEAGKFLLLQGAFKLFAQAGDYEAAVAVVGQLETEIHDFNYEVTIELCDAEISRKAREQVPQLFALKEEARRIIYFRKQLPIREAALQKNSKDATAIRQLGECYAEIGKWSEALGVFGTGTDELAQVALGEKSRTLPAQDCADFWWNYEPDPSYTTPVFKLHAAELYRRALTNAAFNGLRRELAEMRIAEIGKTVVAATCSSEKLDNLVLDLGCWRKLELIACPAGSFTMGESDQPEGDEVRKHMVRITRPFYLSKVPVTQGQWNAVLDPQGDLTEEKARCGGSLSEKRRFFDALNRKFASRIPKGYCFRLPTDAEYSYAMTSGGKQIVSRESLGIANRPRVSWGNRNTEKVGQGTPTAWGFTDALRHGDVEFLDIVSVGSPSRSLRVDKTTIKLISYPDEEVDPLCLDSSSLKTDCERIFSLCGHPDMFWKRTLPNGPRVEWNTCIRICLGPDLVAEKQAAAKNNHAERKKKNALSFHE